MEAKAKPKRRTQAEIRAAQQEAARLEVEQRRAELLAGWADRVMTALEKAQRHGMTIYVRDGAFEVTGMDAYEDHVVVVFHIKPEGEVFQHYVSGDFEMLEDLEGKLHALDRMEQEREERRRLRASAIAKLTPEEREALGVS